MPAARRFARKSPAPASPPPEAKPESAPAPRRAVESAESMARRQRDISVSEFFLKNRHLLGFDSPRRALVTAVKDGRIKRGDLVLMEAMGGGFTWGAALVRW